MTNGAAIGYMIIAARRAKIDKKTIQLLELMMATAMDEVTEDVAEHVFKKT